MMMSDERQLGRAKNAVLEFMEKRLSVPKIYIDAEWSGSKVSVLAIDRDGVGDVHAVLLFARKFISQETPQIVFEAEAIEKLLDQFTNIAAQFKYVGAVDTRPGRFHPFFSLPDPLVDKSFAADGLGRVGFFTISAPTDEEPNVKLIAKPERFRAAIGKLADDYVQKHTADWEIRA